MTEDDFYFAKDGSTVQKLDVLESMMEIKHNAMMIGDFTDRGPKLFTEKAAGNICGCIGFVKDRNTGLNVPNTLLKKDIRDVVGNPVQKIYAVFSKMYMDEKYALIEKMDKSLSANIVGNRRCQIVSQAVIEVCHRLGVNVSAAGVETQDQLNVLKEMGCDYVQGSLFNKPITVDTFEVRYLKG